MSSIWDWSYTAASNNNSDSIIAWSDSMAPSNVDNSSRAMMQRVAEFRGDLAGTVTVGGSANAITITSRSPFTTYANGLLLAFKAGATNTAATTLNVNSIGTKSIRKVTSSGDVALAGGEIRDDCVYLLHYSEEANGGSGGWLMVNPTQNNAQRGHIFGLTLSNNSSDATNDIDIAAGEAASTESSPVLLTLPSTMTKRSDAAWAVGSGNGGWLDGGSMPNGTGHAFIIGRSDTGAVDIGLSASATNPPLPANYDRKRRIGSILRRSGAIVSFSQFGDTFKISPISDKASTTALSAQLYAVAVPAGISVSPMFRVFLRCGASVTTAMQMGSAAEGGVSFSVATIVTGSGDSDDAITVMVPPMFITNTSGQIYFEQTNTTGTPTTVSLLTIGWVDRRGQDGGA